MTAIFLILKSFVARETKYPINIANSKRITIESINEIMAVGLRFKYS